MYEDFMDEYSIPEIKSIGMFRIVHAYEPMPMERHDDAFELLYLRSGQRPFQIGDTEIDLLGGDLVVIPPGMEHGQNSVQNRSSLFFLIIQEPEKCENFLSMSAEQRKKLQQLLMQCHSKPMHLPSGAQKLIEEIFDMMNGVEDDGEQLLFEALLRAKLTLLLCGILKAARSLQENKRPLSADIARALEYMEECTDSTPSVAELAARAGLSEVWFKQKFKRAMGMPPAEYCLRHKLKIAGEKLLQTSQSITDIAMSLGFSSSQHFSAAFRHYLGCSPSDYRKNGGSLE